MSDYDINGNVLATSNESFVTNAKVCAIGDSNTQYMGSNLETNVKKYVGIQSLKNFGTAGATWEVREGEDASVTNNSSAVGKVNQLIANANVDTNMCTDYDIITIMMGTNCLVVGDKTNTSSDVGTMCGAIRYCLEKLLYYYRKSRMGVIIPPQRAEINVEQNQRNELIRKLCQEYSIPILDFYYEGQVVPDSTTPNGSLYYLSDGTHLGGNGQEQFYRKYSAFINRL